MEGRRVEKGEIVIPRREVLAWIVLGLAITIPVGVLVGFVIADTLKGVAITF